MVRKVLSCCWWKIKIKFLYPGTRSSQKSNKLLPAVCLTLQSFMKTCQTVFRYSSQLTLLHTHTHTHSGRCKCIDTNRSIFKYYGKQILFCCWILVWWLQTINNIFAALFCLLLYYKNVALSLILKESRFDLKSKNRFIDLFKFYWNTDVCSGPIIGLMEVFMPLGFKARSASYLQGCEKAINLIRPCSPLWSMAL